MNETQDIVKPIVRGLMLLGWPVFRMNAGGFKLESGGFVHGHKSGTPDICTGYKSEDRYLLAWIECKQPTGTLSWNQVKFLREAHKLSIPWLVATDWDCVERWRKDISYHGADRFTRPVLDPLYTHEAPRLRTVVRKPSPYDALIAQRDGRIKAQLDSIGEPPF